MEKTAVSKLRRVMLCVSVFLFALSCLNLNAEELLPFGQFSKTPWEAKGFFAFNDSVAELDENWYKPTFDDTGWTDITGPLSSESDLSYYNTLWDDGLSTYWLRRHFVIDSLDVNRNYYFYIAHDDNCVVYLNGIEIFNVIGWSGDTYDVVVLSSDSVQKMLKQGDNVMAVKISDTAGGRCIDFGLYNTLQKDGAISAGGDVEISIDNDDKHPWSISKNQITNGNLGYKYSSSSLSFSYNSKMRTVLSFDWANYQYSSSHKLYLYVDGVYKASTTNSNYSSLRYFLDAGEHIVTIKDTVGNSTSTDNWSKIKNIKVRNISALEKTVLSANSQPLTFTNDDTWPWTKEDGYIQNSNYENNHTASRFSTTFTITEPSKFSFWSSTYCYYNGESHAYSGYHYFDFKINGEMYDYRNCSEGIFSVLLEPGEYTMEWCDTIYNHSSYVCKSKVSDIELSSNWVDVDLASNAGTLGVEVLYQVDVLKDVELLKVKGTMNASDWATIKQMTNLLALDLTDAKFDALPDYAFDGMSEISSVKLPEGCKSIGQYAFRGTQIWNIDIPSSVTYIGQYAFSHTRLKSVNFKEDSQLQYIGYFAFLGTNLEEFIMPNTVTKLGSENDRYSSDYDQSFVACCSNLKKIHFSDALTTLEGWVCNSCPKLTDVHLPNNLISIRNGAFQGCSSLRHIDFPSTLTRVDNEAFKNCGIDSVKLPVTLSTIENYAFRNCDKLKYIELPSYIGNYNYNFYDCDAVEKVVCQSATPPAISNDPFAEGPAKSNITLVVPSFAVVNYKLDPYWYQFGTIIEGDDIDYWRIAGPLSLMNNRRMNGKPDIELYEGGSLRVGGAAPMEVKNMTVWISEGNPSRLLNDCPSMTADSLASKFWVEANRWYFFTPLHDVVLSKVTHSANASYVFRYYDGESRATNGTGSSWRNVETAKLMAGQGYIFHCNAAGWLTFPAETSVHSQVLITDDVTKQLAAYESTAAANKSWNYVGNPFPCYYDIYYMDFTAPITVWTGSTYKAYSIADDDFVLRPMQSFFVQKPDAVDQIIFHKEGRQVEATVNRASYVKAEAAPKDKASRLFFNLRISDDETGDDTRIVVNEEAAQSYEMERDASKFMSMDGNVPQLFSIDTEDNRYAINERPCGDGTVRLGYYAGKAGFYTLSALRTDGEAELYDKVLNKTVKLHEQDYTFHSEATPSADTERFVLTVRANTGETAILSTETGDRISVLGADGKITIRATEATVLIYTTDGRLVKNLEVSGTAQAEVSRGTYIVKANDETFKVVVY